MKLAFLAFEENSIWTPDSPFIHLKGWWTPPNYVLEFWAFGCKFNYDSEEDYQNKKTYIIESRNRSIKDFWNIMVL